MSENHAELIELYKSQLHLFEHFKRGVVDSFALEPELNGATNPIIHSIKSRLKDPHHLQDKLQRKAIKKDCEIITKDNFFKRVTDLAGVRILHLHQDQFSSIYEFIEKKLKSDWTLVEKPVANSWDPEAIDFFRRFGLEAKVNHTTYYTSVHYVVKPSNSESPVCCEIQVRSLFEEIWGEIDHAINYPNPTLSNTCKEQLRVLSKLVSTGTRLADSIFRAHIEDAAAAAEKLNKEPDVKTQSLFD